MHLHLYFSLFLGLLRQPIKFCFCYWQGGSSYDTFVSLASSPTTPLLFLASSSFFLFSCAFFYFSSSFFFFFSPSNLSLSTFSSLSFFSLSFLSFCTFSAFSFFTFSFSNLSRSSCSFCSSFLFEVSPETIMSRSPKLSSESPLHWWPSS